MLRLPGARFKRGRSVTAADPVAWADPEMSRLQADLAAVAEELALAEAELAEARALLRVFARAHDRLLAPLHAELDEIEARIAEACAAASGHPDDIRDAQKARARVRESAASAGNVSGQAGPVARPEPPPAEAKALYRTAALGRLDLLAGQLRSRIGERRRVLADLTGARP
jgi:septal ring factor EnvC (AmiA/AmiB activator)